MRVLKLLRGTLGILLAGYALGVSAAQIIVSPGTGTLAAAVASASNGDTLILGEGGYSGDVTVDKSLVIRAQTRATNAVVAGILKVEGSGIDVTVQGITFTQSTEIWQADSVRLLQNHWLSGSIEVTQYETSAGDGQLVVIGNRLENGNIRSVASENSYIAGNVLLNGQIATNASAWIVGNDVRFSQAIVTSGAGTSARIIGNRISCGVGECIHANSAATSIIKGNMVKLAIKNNSVAYGISAIGSNASIVNNTIVANGTPLSYHVGIGCGASGVISGNIVIGLGKVFNASFATSNVPCSQLTTPITNNLCFSNSVACPAGNGNLNADPKFADLVDYRLSPTSPAIDAGPNDFQLADLDRSRNDMGAYGGPWSIAQYDVQRDPSSYAPYVYPLFPGGAAFSGGTLDLQALGVAKLR